MSHTVGEKAAMAVKNSQKKTGAVETRTHAEIIKTLRGNLNSPLAILKTDVAVLLAAYDLLSERFEKNARLLESETIACAAFRTRISDLLAVQEQLAAKIEEFRAVYEAENSSQSVKLERFATMPAVLGASYDLANAVSRKEAFEMFAETINEKPSV